MKFIGEHLQGMVLTVRAKPGASKNEILGPYGDSLKISVQAPPEKGKANKAIEDLLKKKLSLKSSQIELLTGQTSGKKQFLITEISREELEKRLEGCMGGGSGQTHQNLL